MDKASLEKSMTPLEIVFYKTCLEKINKAIDDKQTHIIIKNADWPSGFFSNGKMNFSRNGDIVWTYDNDTNKVYHCLSAHFFNKKEYMVSFGGVYGGTGVGLTNLNDTEYFEKFWTERLEKICNKIVNDCFRTIKIKRKELKRNPQSFSLDTKELRLTGIEWNMLMHKISKRLENNGYKIICEKPHSKYKIELRD